MAHLDHDTLLNYLEGGLTVEEHGRAAAHLAEPCERCAEQLRLLKAVTESAAADRTVAPPARVLQHALEIARAGAQPARPSVRTRVVAALGFDSHRQLSAAATRGPARVRQMLFATAQVDIDLQMKRGGDTYDMLGQVLGSQGSGGPLAAFVSLHTPAGELLRSTETDPGGQFAFRRIPSGSYELVFELEDQEVAVTGLELQHD